MFKWFKQYHFKRITKEELKELMLENKEDKIFVDIRSKYVFKKNPTKGFKNIPIDKLLKRVNEIPKDKYIIIKGDGKNSASVMCRQLKKMGYEKIVCVIENQ